MSQDHIIAAILTAGLVVRNSGKELYQKDVVTLYELTLASHIASKRPQKES